MSGSERNGRERDEELPPADTRRWTPRHKARVVEAVRELRLTAEEACRRYSLAPEELASWERDLTQHGMDGLRVRHLQTWRGRHTERAGGQG
jgi:transposase-like protein